MPETARTLSSVLRATSHPAWNCILAGRLRTDSGNVALVLTRAEAYPNGPKDLIVRYLGFRRVVLCWIVLRRLHDYLALGPSSRRVIFKNCRFRC